MALLDGPVPIETDDHVLRARRTAAVTRVVVGVAGAVLIIAHPELLPRPALGVIGCVTLLLTAIVQILAPRLAWLSVEESLSGLAGLLIIGLAGQRISILTLLWLVALACGVLARGGRVHWLGRNIVLFSLALPVLHYGELSAEYGAFCIATIGLLLTSGRLTRELNLQLRQARLEAESVETLLLAGDIASRMAGREEPPTPEEAIAIEARKGARVASRSEDRMALARLIDGEGVAMAVQPILDVRSNAIHAYEALARFDRQLFDGSPLHWFSLAEELGVRAELERACLGKALELFPRRPPGTGLMVNLSAPVLLEAQTMDMLHAAGARRQGDLRGLTVEITEETLVRSNEELSGAIAPLRARGAILAVDDMGAGYSGLRQITSVLPGYLKLDRSLVCGIDADPDRAALVGALAGYSTQVGSLLVAEGIETRAELEAVRRLGVPLVQGFYLARPGEPWPEVTIGLESDGVEPGGSARRETAGAGVLQPAG